MNAAAHLPCVRPAGPRDGADLRGILGGLAWLALVTGGAWALTRETAGWVAMWAIAGAQFGLLKAATLRRWTGEASRARRVAYLGLWVGMDAPAFLRSGPVSRAGRPGGSELAFAFAKTALGLALLFAAVRSAGVAGPLTVGWLGMLGLIFTLHFGVFHLLSWSWRRAGVAAPPIMRAPIAATSLAEFWGERWNIAFAECARWLWLRPLARRWGVRRAGAWVFLISGLVHETVVSLPARGGWGGPTAYFLLQAAGVAAEKSGCGRGLGLGVGARGWAWTVMVTAGPLPLLFHAPFAERVIAPFCEFLKEVL